MPYLILIIGLLIGLFALYRFIVKASPAQVKTLFRSFIIVIHIMVMLFFAVTGRIIISIGLVLLAIPFVIAYFKGKITKRDKNHDE